MKRFTKALLTFACAASIVIGIPTCAHAEEDTYSDDVKPNVITTMMHLGKGEEKRYWMGQNDAAKITNVKVKDIAAHRAIVSFDYELFNVKDLKKISFIVSVRKYSQIMVTSRSLMGFSISYNIGDVDPVDNRNENKDKNKKKDSSKDDFKIHELTIPFFSDDPASGYVRGQDYYSYGFPDKLPTKKKGHAQVSVSTMPATTYTNTQNIGDPSEVVRVEKGEVTDPIKPFIDTFTLMRWMGHKISLQDGTANKPIDIDVQTTYVGIHADYKNGSAIYFNNNAVQVPTFTTLKNDPPSQCSLGNHKKDSSKNGNNNAAENASANNSSTMTPLQRAFNSNTVSFIIAVVAAVLLVAICIALLVRRSLSKKKAIANEESLTAEETAEDSETETSETETSETEEAAEVDDSKEAAETTETVEPAEDTESTETTSASEQPEA